MKIAVPLLFILAGAVCAQQHDPFAGSSEKIMKAAELAQCANGHKTLKDIPLVYGHVGGLMRSPETAARAERGEILFGGCMGGGRDHWVACQTCGLLYDDERDAWLEAHPPRPGSPEGKNNPPCSLETFQRFLSKEILGIALKVAADKPAFLSCSRWHEASGIVAEQAHVISKAKDSEVAQMLDTWFKDKGAPKSPVADRAETDGRTWKWESEDKVFVVSTSSLGPDETSIGIEWHRKKTPSDGDKPDDAAIQKQLEELRRENEQLRKEICALTDHTVGKSDMCPVHSLKMPARDVPVIYGLLAFNEPAPDSNTRSREFPFARDWIAGGCVVSSESPKTGKAFVCPKCIEAERTWDKAHAK